MLFVYNMKTLESNLYSNNVSSTIFQVQSNLDTTRPGRVSKPLNRIVIEARIRDNYIITH